MKVAVLFDNFGPYHLARLEAVAGEGELLAIEFAASSGEYAWKTGAGGSFRRIVIQPRGRSSELRTRDFRFRLGEVLSDFRPQVVAIPGWAARGALLSLEWCVRNRTPTVLMSESTAWDEPRNAVKEWLKRRVVGLASAALAGGTSHRDYLVQLGMPADRIFLGYDAVDNAYFKESTAKVRQQECVVVKNYFLASNRFIEKKNLFRLLRAYRAYAIRQHATAWDLVLLGDGPLRTALKEECGAIGLSIKDGAPWDFPTGEGAGCVFFPGFRQIEELSLFYARAGAFIHASTTEQWGLVVNEAMASGLPVIVSSRCGCAGDLVQEGVNGYTFDPFDPEQLTMLMLRVSSLSVSERLFLGAEGQRIVSQWGPERFAEGLMAAGGKAISTEQRSPSWLQRLVISGLLNARS